LLSIGSQQSEGPVQSDSLIASPDQATDVVPLSVRRGRLTMGLLWLTMVTGFPSVLIGFDWFKSGLTLSQVVQNVIASCLILLLYSIPACYLGARSGQTFGLLSREVFGRWGSWFVSFNLVWISIGWYGLNAIFLAEGLIGLYHWQIPLALLAGSLAVAMAFNNFFGFTGIANFARYLAAPVLIIWVAYTFAKAAASCPQTVWLEPAHAMFPSPLTVVSSFVIGYGVWGNEADYWRYGRPRVWQSVIPLVVSLAIGELCFPVAGWMLAKTTGVTDYAAATALMNHYAFGGFTLIAAIVLSITYFAVNDSGLYGAINALENIRELPRRKVVTLLTASGALVAATLSFNGKAFELVTTVSSIVLPCATVVIMAEHFILRRAWGVDSNFSRVLSLAELPRLRAPALSAVLAGFLVGVCTSGLIDGLKVLHVGVCSLQAWIATLLVYIPLRSLERKQQLEQRRRFLEKLSDWGNEAALSAASVNKRC
jgi:purine-cytosine permease-like protein